jgi:glycosyltransferase involved in cell wall biosynthesis
LNQIIAESKYDFLARMDADDLISPYRLERQLNVLLADSSVDVVSTGVCSLSNDSKPMGMRVYANKEHLSLKDMLLGRSGVVHASILARKSWFLRNQYDTKQLLTEDYELWLRAFLKDDFNVRLIEEPLYYYREEGNVTAAKLLRAYASQRAVIKKSASPKIPTLDLMAVLLSFHLKSLVVRGLSLANKMELLHQRRSELAMDDSILNGFYQEIAIIQNTKVPGLG